MTYVGDQFGNDGPLPKYNWRKSKMGKIKRRELEQRIIDQEDEIDGLKSDLEDAVYANKQLSAEVSNLNDDLDRLTPFPYWDGDVIVLGPQVFAAKDENVINWKGENYVPQQDDWDRETAEALAYLDELEIVALRAALDVEGKGPILVELTTIDFQNKEAQTKFLDLIEGQVVRDLIEDLRTAVDDKTKKYWEVLDKERYESAKV